MINNFDIPEPFFLPLDHLSSSQLNQTQQPTSTHSPIISPNLIEIS